MSAADWAMAHPVLFTILALPCVLTFCAIMLGAMGFSFSRSS